MELDDHDFPVVRKNLNVISVLILVLAYTNAKLNKLSFLGIDIELDAHKLYIALFVLYAYFIWRFLTKLPLNSIFWTGFMQYYLESERGLKTKYNFKKFGSIMMSKSERLKQGFKDETINLVSTTIHRPDSSYHRKLRLIFTFYDRKPRDKQSPGNFSLDHNFTVSRLLFVQKLVIFCFKHDKFGDYLFPLIPVLVNLGFFVFASEWQGSIRSLWFS